MKQLTLKKAIETNQLDKFIEQNQDKAGDQQTFDTVLRSMTNNKKKAHQTSEKDSSGN